MDAVNDQFVWHCPSCGRRVPRRVEECRCGFRQPADEMVIAAPVPNDQVPARGRRQLRLKTIMLLGIALLLGAGVAAVSLRSWWAPAPPPAATVATSATTDTPSAALTQPGAPFTLTPLTSPATRGAGPADGSSLSASPGAAAPPVAPASAAVAGSFEDVVARTLPAVVSIHAGQARGTGFFIRPDSVLTNAHVVEGQSSVQLQAGDTRYSARVVRVSPGTDLAVLQVANANPSQPVLKLGSVAGVRAGQEVIAIGSALGVLSNTVTRGIVSAVRQAGAVTLLQTDAAINPGNSGGPLIDRSGTVIGINSMGIARQVGEGLAFAVAIDHAAALISGQAPMAAAATPLASLNRAMGGPTEGDQRRLGGEAAYRKTLEWAVGNADQLDTYWNRYAQACVMSASRGGDRPWFAVYEANAVRLTNTSGYDCGSWLESVRSNAGTIRTEITRASETARQSGVYPGVMRDLRRQHRLDWSGWDR